MSERAMVKGSVQASKTVRERDVRDNKDKQKDEAITADNGGCPCAHTRTQYVQRRAQGQPYR